MRQPNLRDMLKTSAVIGAGLWLGTSPQVRAQSPNDKLNVACIGVDGQGGYSVNGVSHENVVATCDVEEVRAGKILTRFELAKIYEDLPKMLDDMDKSIDAVTVATPHHTHFHPSRQAILMGKHCYCEKPLAHSAWEVRELTTIANKMGVATQLGNQRHAFEGMRRTVEALQASVIGDVKEVYSFIGGKRGMPPMPTDFPTAPSTLDWDLWLGPAKGRPYSPDYCRYKWRSWWDFGTGETGNWGCQILEIPFWALSLNYPPRIDLDEIPTAPDIDPGRTPTTMKTRLEFPAKPGHGPLSLHWCHVASSSDIFTKYGAKGVGNTLFIGTKGVIAAGFDNHTVTIFDGSTPDEPPKTIPTSPAFHPECINACKGGPRSTCDRVNYTGALAESIILANAAFRAGAGFDWNVEEFKASGNPKAEDHVFPDFREDWKV